MKDKRYDAEVVNPVLHRDGILVSSDQRLPVTLDTSKLDSLFNFDVSSPQITSVMSLKILYNSCHSGLDTESILFYVDSRLRGNDIGNPFVKLCQRQYT